MTVLITATARGALGSPGRRVDWSQPKDDHRSNRATTGFRRVGLVPGPLRVERELSL